MQLAGRAGGKTRDDALQDGAHHPTLQRPRAACYAGPIMPTKAQVILDAANLKKAMRHLAKVDPDFARILKEVGHPELREMPTGFSGLMRSIVGQQVSVHAARSIWLRLEAAAPTMEPADFLALSDEQLRAVGLSGAKTRYGRSLATDIVEGRIDFNALHELDDAAAIAMLCQAKGIGPWTAEIYLMFAHGRPDIMPGLDLGLVVAAQHLKKLRKRPDAKRLLKIAEQWRPWRSAAALLLWHYRRSMPDWGPKPLKAEAKAK
jgi:DNA-3-methyladenine glycosylase II